MRFERWASSVTGAWLVACFIQFHSAKMNGIVRLKPTHRQRQTKGKTVACCLLAVRNVVCGTAAAAAVHSEIARIDYLIKRHNLEKEDTHRHNAGD